jgi:hypothetical protein
MVLLFLCSYSAPSFEGFIAQHFGFITDLHSAPSDALNAPGIYRAIRQRWIELIPCHRVVLHLTTYAAAVVVRAGMNEANGTSESAARACPKNLPEADLH